MHRFGTFMVVTSIICNALSFGSFKIFVIVSSLSWLWITLWFVGYINGLGDPNCKVSSEWCCSYCLGYDLGARFIKIHVESLGSNHNQIINLVAQFFSEYGGLPWVIRTCYESLGLNYRMSSVNPIGFCVDYNWNL